MIGTHFYGKHLVLLFVVHTPKSVLLEGIMTTVKRGILNVSYH